MSDEELRHIRGREIAMIYQEPMASLNPAMKVGRQLMEVPMIHQGMAKEAARALRAPDGGRCAPARPRPYPGCLSAPACRAGSSSASSLPWR
jgi:peptide/nickel transport system ATP-binding protein